MAISSAIKGAVVPVSELGEQNLNDLINQGYISPREGGQSFEFLKPWSMGAGSPATGAGSTTGVGGTDFASLLSNAESSGLLQSSEDVASEVSAMEADREKRKQQIQDQFAPELQGLETEKERGTTGAQAQGYRLGGMGFSTVGKENIDKEIDFRNKQIARMKQLESDAIANNDFEYAKEIRTFKENAKKERLDMLKWSFEQEKQSEQFERQQSLSETTAERNYGLNLRELDMNQTQFDEQMDFNQKQFDESIKQFGETMAYNKLKDSISQAESAADREIQFQTLLNNTPAGQSVSITLPDGTTKTGVGRERIAGVGGGAGADRLLTEAELKTYGMPVGSHLSDIMGQFPGQPNYSAWLSQKSQQLGMSIDIDNPYWKSLYELENPAEYKPVGSAGLTQNQVTKLNQVQEEINTGSKSLVQAQQENPDIAAWLKAKGATSGGVRVDPTTGFLIID